MNNEKRFTLAREIIARLTSAGKTLAIAESFTGGGVASTLVTINGASSVFIDGIVCYSHSAKTHRLGISEEIIDKHGAVSEIIAKAMSCALLGSPLKPDYALATTGNAGPTAEDKSSVGEAYVSVADVNGVEVVKLNLSGDRVENIADGVLCALEILLKFIKKEEL